MYYIHIYIYRVVLDISAKWHVTEETNIARLLKNMATLKLTAAEIWRVCRIGFPIYRLGNSHF